MSEWTRERFDQEIRETVGSTSQVIDLYRRWLNQIWEDRDRLSALASAAAAARDTAVGDQKITSKAINKVKAELREARLAQRRPTYRLPDWLGSHAVTRIVSRSDEGMALVDFDALGAERRIWLMQDDLHEVPPPCTCPDHMRDHP